MIDSFSKVSSCFSLSSYLISQFLQLTMFQLDMERRNFQLRYDQLAGERTGQTSRPR